MSAAILTIDHALAARPSAFPAMSGPKPTLYRGVRMASRLESQWAVFFDNRSIAWAYEPHRLRLSGEDTDYLPDFHLPEIGTWFEAKGGLDLRLIAKPMALWEQVTRVGQRVAIGTSNGRVAVPWRRADGAVSMAGACACCSRCGGTWFANPEDPSAGMCLWCGDADGGVASVKAAAAAISAGLVPGWPGGFDPTHYRSLVEDA
ncbi:hypothetical protein [Roseomonas genomospecies 6]|uniref:Uncharacterized protein n=1 Tax=Roseomonas genomospecies 6 TaxID=214106 RepID=A0A9W7KQK3_9PROT|nr:hypothetical protein [Roseomonas genomospecies 6]KAA0677665.1 hypothetical protein DS843_22770 [Roseomonas genomospecies 6]